MSGQIKLIDPGTSLSIGQISNIKGHIILKGGNPSTGIYYLAESYDECQTISSLTVPGPAGYLSGTVLRWDTIHSFMLLTNPNSPSTNTRIYRSSDNCNTWSPILDTTGLEIISIAFWSDLEGIAAGTFYKLIRTSNGGQSWQTGPMFTLVPYLLRAFEDSAVVAGDGGGAIYLSEDRGNSWATIGGFGNNSVPRDFCMLNKDTIFGVSSTGPFATNFTCMTRTGAIWKSQNSKAPMESPYKVLFKSAKEGYMIGMNADYDGIIALTKDLGKNWETFNTHIKSQLYDMSFLNDSVALVCGSNGVLFTWNKKNTVFTDIEDHGTRLQWSIHPIPAKEKLNITLGSVSDSRLWITVYDLTGRQVNFNLRSDTEIDISGLESGIYFLQIKTDKHTSTSKFIVEK